MYINANLDTFKPLFLLGTSIIRTYAMGIKYAFFYELSLTCADTDPLQGISEESSVDVNVSFIGASSLTSGNYLSTVLTIVPTTADPTQSNTATNSTATSMPLVVSAVPVCLAMLMVISLWLEP